MNGVPMKRALLLASLLTFPLSLAALAASPLGWDSTFMRKGSIATPDTDAGAVCLAVNGASYVLAECHQSGLTTPVDTYLGTATSAVVPFTLPDAGIVYDGGTCNPLSDGGATCSLVRFTLGEKFYRRVRASDRVVCALSTPDGGATVCEVFTGAP